MAWIQLSYSSRENIDLRLFRACRDGDQTVIASLLERGANPTKPFFFKPSNPRRDAYSCTSVHAASQNGHIKCLKFLIETKNINPNILDSNRQTPLHHACENGHKSIVQYLLAHLKCIPTFKNKNRNTPLHFASRNGHLECVKHLFEVCTSHFIDPNARNKYKQTPVHYACFNGHGNIVKYLLTHATCKPNTKNVFGYTPLHLACRNGHIECVDLIIKTSTVDIHTSRTKSYQTALHLACEHGRKNVTEYLLTRAKCNPNIQDFCRNTPLHVASRNGHPDCVKLIVEQSTVRVDPDLMNESKETALFIACEKGHKDIVEYLLTHAKCNPNIKDKMGNTLLHIATPKGELEMLKLVIETSVISVDPDMVNNDKQTALHIACKNGHRDIVEYTLKHTTCNPNIQDIHGNTPLHIASRDGHPECVKLIIETSTVTVDPNMTNIKKKTALHIASENGYKNVLQCLLSHAECNPNVQDIHGNTPLHIACREGHLECVKLIVKTSTVTVDPNLTNIKMQTALHIACRYGHRIIAEYLVTHTECNPNVQDIQRSTPLHILSLNSHLECVKLIVKNSTVTVDPNLTNGNKQTALHVACEYGHRNIAEYLVTHTECNPNVQDIQRSTPLHIISRIGHLECVKLIVKTSTVRVDPNLTNRYKQTALHIACEYDHRNIAEYLVTHTECNPNVQDIQRSTPLHIISRKGHLECVKLIVETSTVRVDPNLTNKNKQTALHIACEYNHRNIAEYLVTHTECNPNVQDIHGNTPLHLASHEGHLGCVKLITETRVDPNLTNHNNQTALHLASENDHRNIAKYLLTHAECNPNVQDIHGNTPLHIACENGRKSITGCLLTHAECKPNIQDFYGNTPLHITTWKGELEMVKSIFETSTVSIDPDVSNNDKQTALHIACKKGHRDIAEYLLTHTTCNLNVQDSQRNTPLHIASHSGHMECVKLIVETRVDLNLTSKNNQTTLHIACEYGHRNIAEYLLTKAECNPNVQEVHGNTPLHIVSRNGHLGCVKLIIETSTVRVDPNLTNRNKQTALHIACEYGHRNIAEYLLTKAECNPNIQEVHGNTPLHLASRNGHLGCVKLIFETSTVRVDPNLTNRNKQTALHIACEYGHRNIAEYLLTKAECNPNVQEVHGNTPLHIVSRNGELECVKLIVKTSTVGVDPNLTNRNKQTALHVACEYGHRNIAEYLLTKAECNPNIQEVHRNTPLHLASRNGHLGCVKLIIETSTVRVDPNLTNRNKQTALHIACEYGHRNLAEYLVIHTECDPNVQDIHENTPLHIICRNGHLECVELIVETSTVRVDLNLTNKKNQTALYLACEYGHRNIAEYLLTKAECNPNVQDNDGNTPLHIICRNGHLERVKLIVETSTVRVDPNLTNRNKQTALYLACEYGHRNIAEYLLTKAECNPNVQDIHGNTPLHINIGKGKLEWVKSIFETSTVSIDPDVSNNHNQTALHIACEYGHRDIAEYLLTHTTCNPNVQNIHGNTPLHFASRKGHLECVKLIVETNTISIDPNLTNKKNQTALHLASINGHKNVLKYLLICAQCNPNLRDINGNTPLYFASQNGHLECVILIIETSTVSVDPDVFNNDNQTALHISCKNGHRDIAEYLLTQAKCNPNVRDIKGNTPLHFACGSGHMECVKLIITEWCNPYVQDVSGNTPLHIACRKGYLECVKVLIADSINPNLTNYPHNQTALHLACDNGHRNIAEYLLAHAKCNSNIQDTFGNTPLHVATWKSDLDLVKLVFESSAVSIDPDVSNNDKQTALHIACKNGHSHIAEYLLTQAKCNPNVVTKNGNTPLHIACGNGHSHIAEYLLTQAKCNPNVVTKSGDTPLHIACSNGDLEIVISIIETSTLRINLDVINNNKQTALHIVCMNAHKEITAYLLSCPGCNPNIKDNHGNTPLHIASSSNFYDIVKVIVENVHNIVDVHLTNNHRQTALHLACKHGHNDIVEFLVSQAKCHPNVKEENGDTPLHIASRQGHLECVETIAVTKEVNPDEPNIVQQTALHLACIHSHIPVVKCLLVNTTCNPNLKDEHGYTPFHYAASSHKIIQLLIQHGANPQNVYKEYGKVLGKHAKQPPKTCTNVVIIGDSGAGKTTLIEALKKEKSYFMKLLLTTDVITEVETKTAGIIPHEFESREYGKVTFYDLAGHREYYSSHSAVLKSLTGTCPPTTFLVTDISKCDDDVKQSVTYWVNFLENQFPEKEATKLSVIVVGSHLDKVFNSSSIGETTSMIEEIINDSDSIEYGGFVPMNCQKCESAGMTKLRQCLKVFTPRLQTQERICFNARCFHVYLVDEYQDLKAVSLRQVQSDISEDCNWEQNMKQDVSYFLPESLYHLCRLCEDLNDRGIVLFLKNATNLPDSWIVMDKSGILSEINGTVFASDNLKQFERLSSSTGVVPVSRLKEIFPHYDMKMLVGVLQYFEFCHDVCEQLIMLIHKQNERDSTCMEQADAPTLKKKHHLFFPSLVRVEAPNDLWEPNPQNQIHFGWIIQCTQPQKSFLPRFQSVLCNRLVFKFALAPDPEEIDPTIPALQRKCSVWKNGIYWGTRQGMETLVEVDTHCKSVVLLMQCRQMSADFRKLRFEVIQTILKCAEEFCPKIKTAISLITRKDISYPLKPVSELISISLPEVITAVRENSDSAVSKDGKPTPLEDLIGTGTKIEVSWLLLYTLCIAILFNGLYSAPPPFLLTLTTVNVDMYLLLSMSHTGNTCL